MTNQEIQALIDGAVAEFKETTVGYISTKNCKHTWTIPPPGTHWANGLDFLVKARKALDVVPPVPPPSTEPVPPATDIPLIDASAVVCTSVSDFWAKYNSGASAIEARGIAFSGQVNLHRPYGQTIWATQGTIFQGNAVDYNGVWLGGKNTLYGDGTTILTNPVGGGLLISSGSDDAVAPDVRAWGLVCKDCGGTGFGSMGTANKSGLQVPNKVDVQAKIINCGFYLPIDPHWKNGGQGLSGLHGAYVGGGHAPTVGRIIVDVRDEVGGAAVQCGAYSGNKATGEVLELWIDATNCLYDTSNTAKYPIGSGGYHQQGGNGFQPWGDQNGKAVVKRLKCDRVARGVDGTPDSGNFIIEWARTANARLTPVYVPFQFVTYQDCK